MQVTRRGDLYKVARITGPTHNDLAIRFGKPDGRKPHIVSLDDGVKVRSMLPRFATKCPKASPMRTSAWERLTKSP